MIDKTKYYQSRLQESDFLKISKFVEQNYGIRLPVSKMIMVQNRLYKRLIATGIMTFEEYVKFIFSPQGRDEIEAMVDELTTNKTEFFREKAHFDFLEKEVFSKLSGNQIFKIWSAGCSTGEEAYSLGITADLNKVKFSIIGTDLSEKALETAKKGVYPQSSVANIPKYILQTYFSKQVVDNKTFFSVKNILKNHINFYKLNLKNNRYEVPFDFDVIFLRNVLIYFSLDTQNEVLTKVINHLKPGGYLFIGFSETVYNRGLPLKRMAPSVYQKI